MRHRIIVTQRCNRNCEYCCNKQHGLLDSAIRILRPQDIPIRSGDEVIVTGGEPALAHARVLAILKHTRDMGVKRYLYTAHWNWAISELASCFDGITYTIHADASAADIGRFNAFNNYAGLLHRMYDRSLRLRVNRKCRLHITWDHDAFSHVEFIDFTDDCPLPAGEKLYVWDGPE